MTTRRTKPVVRTQDYVGPRGWLFCARKQLQFDGMIYPRGSVLPLEEISPEAIKRLIDTKCAEWIKPSPTGDKRPLPRKIDVAPAEKPRPKFKLIQGKNPLDTYHMTRGALIAECGNNPSLADDIIAADAQGRHMYLTACREAGRSL
jgi:hypothetical protein